MWYGTAWYRNVRRLQIEKLVSEYLLYRTVLDILSLSPMYICIYQLRTLVIGNTIMCCNSQLQHILFSLLFFIFLFIMTFKRYYGTVNNDFIEYYFFIINWLQHRYWYRMLVAPYCSVIFKYLKKYFTVMNVIV